MAMRDQDQLRLIMATPRGERKPLEAAPKKSNMGPPPGKKKSSKKPSQAYILKQAMLKEKEELADKDTYRDRAKERRSDANPDFRPEDQALADQIAERYEQAAEWEAGMGPVITGPRKTQEEINKEIEQSKFLGGDMEHTHLVKGLDFALLNKTRSEMEAKAKKEAKARKMMEQIQEQKANPSDVVSAADLVGATAQQKPQQGVVRSSEGGQSKGFQSHIARSIHAQLFGKEEELYGKRRQSEMFLPGRMAFEFSLDTEFQTELPTIITRSKSDCPRLSKKILPQMPDAVLERLEKSMHFVRQCILGKDGKRMKRKVRPTEEQPGAGVMGEAQHPSADRGQDEPAVPPPPPPPASDRKKEDDDSDDDIFAGVGKDYVCEVDETKEKKKQAGGYFGKEKSAEDQGDLSHQAVKNSVMSAVDGVPEQIKETMKARAAEEAKRLRAEKEKKLKRMMEDVPDEYSECYAGYHSNLDRLNVLMQDPDEDKKEKRKKGKGNSKEQELKDEQQRMNNKFNKDYNSIAGIMKDKYDEDIKNEPKRQRYL